MPTIQPLPPMSDLFHSLVTPRDWVAQYLQDQGITVDPAVPSHVLRSLYEPVWMYGPNGDNVAKALDLLKAKVETGWAVNGFATVDEVKLLAALVKKHVRARLPFASAHAEPPTMYNHVTELLVPSPIRHLAVYNECLTLMLSWGSAVASYGFPDARMQGRDRIHELVSKYVGCSAEEFIYQRGDDE